MKAVLVHGFNVRDGGERTVDRLAPYVQEAGWIVSTDEADYGYFSLWMIRLVKSWLRSRVLYRLAKACESADLIITHSNGANFVTQALDMLGPEFNNTKLVVHISPALNRSTPIPNAVKAQLVMHTPHDFWVKLSALLPLHPWGSMGAYGYSGPDNRNRNEKFHDIKEHSAWFSPEKVKNPTWYTIREFLKEYVK